MIEGPKAGGHLGFSQEELADADQMDYDNEIRKIISAVREYEEKYHREIPVIVAGGIYSREDAFHAAELGADGIQAAITVRCNPKSVMQTLPIKWHMSKLKKKML